MTNDDLTRDAVERERDFWRVQKDDPNHTWVPRENAERLERICDELLKKMAEFSPDPVLTPNYPVRPCRACGARVTTMRGYPRGSLESAYTEKWLQAGRYSG